MLIPKTKIISIDLKLLNSSDSIIIPEKDDTKVTINDKLSKSFINIWLYG